MAYRRDRDASIRENILRQITQRFTEMTEADPNAFVLFEKVYRSPLPAKAAIGRSALSILDGKERCEDLIGATGCTLEVSVEFVVKVQLGEDVAPYLNRILLCIERTMMRDPQCRYVDDTETSRQLAVDMSKGQSELDVEGPGDRLVGGIVFWRIKYRHRPDDPSRLRGE